MSELALQSSLWLEVSLAERCWLFELRSDEDRAVVVGSDINSDVLIVRPGVGSTHFHFERAGNAIVLVPGYRASLRVNSVRAVEPVTLPSRATIELLNLSLEAVTHTEKPEHLRITEPPPSPSRLAPREYFENLPDETDPTGFTLAPTSSIMSRPDFDTVEAPRPSFDTQPLPRVALEPELPRTPVASKASCNPTRTPLGPQGTVMLAVPNLDEGEPRARQASVSSSSGTTERLPRPQLGLATALGPAVNKTAELEIPRELASESPRSAVEVTRVEVPAPHRSATSPRAYERAPTSSASVPPAPMTPAAVSPRPLPTPSVGPLAAQRTADFDVSAVASLLVTPPTGTLPAQAQRGPTPSTPPVTSTPSPSAPAAPRLRRKQRARLMAYLALLGSVAQRRPLAVGATATAGAVLLALALVGAARFATRSGAPTPATRAEAAPASSLLVHPASAVTAASVTSPGATPPATQRPTDRAPAVADVAGAASHLLAGRLQEAASAYGQLSAHDPSNPTYGAIARMLAERASVRCSATSRPSGCPEVLP